MKTNELEKAKSNTENVQAHRQSGGGNDSAQAEMSESPQNASAAEAPLCSVQRSCSPLSLGHMSKDFSEFEKSLDRATAKVYYF